MSNNGDWKLYAQVSNDKGKQLFEKAKNFAVGSAGIWTRDLAHPKRESYP